MNPMNRKSPFLNHVLIGVMVILVVGLTNFVIHLDLLLSSATSTISHMEPSSNNEIILTDNNTKFVPISKVDPKKVNVGDIEIAFKTFGNGPPILLISGSGNVMDAWPSHFLKELAKNHTVTIFDNRGVGNTTEGTKPFSVKQFANDTFGLMNVLGIQEADVLGFSMGSFVAQQLVITYPEKVN